MTKIRRLVLITIFSGLSLGLTFFQIPLLPWVSFLQFDLSILPILLALVLLDTKSALGILLLRSALKLLLNSDLTSFVGMPLNIVALGSYVLSFAFFWKASQTRASFIKAALMGTTAMVLAMLVINYLYAIPVYAAVMKFDIAQVYGTWNYLLTMVLPFNLLQGILFSLSFYIIYPVLKPIIKYYET